MCLICSCFRRSALILALLSSVFFAVPAHTHEKVGATAPDQFLSTTPKLSVIGRAPDFTLRDTSGAEVRLLDYRGRVVLLAFIFTSCQTACPLISRQMASIQSKLKKAGLFGTKASLLSVTVDPQTDTAEILVRYARSIGADPTGWRFLLDSPDRLGAVLATYGEWTKPVSGGEIDHPARIYLMDGKANIREVYSLSFFNERQAYLDIQALLHEAM